MRGDNIGPPQFPMKTERVHGQNGGLRQKRRVFAPAVGEIFRALNQGGSDRAEGCVVPTFGCQKRYMQCSCANAWSSCQEYRGLGSQPNPRGSYILMHSENWKKRSRADQNKEFQIQS